MLTVGYPSFRPYPPPFTTSPLISITGDSSTDTLLSDIIQILLDNKIAMEELLTDVNWLAVFVVMIAAQAIFQSIWSHDII